MPVEKKEMTVEELKAENEQLQQKVKELEGVVETLNERVGKFAKLYNTVAELYIQGK